MTFEEDSMPPIARIARAAVALAAIATLTAAPCSAQTPPPARDTIVNINAPLGSRTNPVLAYGPSGEREFLQRLRCADGKIPEVLGRGSSGGGAHGHILDSYALRCGESGVTQSLFMDMYHSPDRETRQVEGFTVLAKHPAQLAQGCPPQVVANADSSARYVFTWYELERPFAQTAPVPEFVLGKGQGYMSVSYIVDTTGRAEQASIKFSGTTDSLAIERGRALVQNILFTPAEHHAGCKVRQGGGRSISIKPDTAR